MVYTCADVPENFGCGDRNWPEIDPYAVRPVKADGTNSETYLVTHLKGSRHDFKVSICDLLTLPGGANDPLARYKNELRTAACAGHSEYPILRRLKREGKIRYEIEVPKDHYMMMGDNRDNSHDSRKWGFVPFGAIKGRAWTIWWANDKARIFDSIHTSKTGGDAAHAAQ